MTKFLPVHKKNSKQLVGNYRRVLLLPVCSKIFEKLLSDIIYEFLDENCFSNQSGFRPNDSNAHQLIAITHDILTATE